MDDLTEHVRILSVALDRIDRLEGVVVTLQKQRDRAWWLAFLTWAVLVASLITGCAHTPPPCHQTCPSWEAGWLEWRSEDCAYWRCNASTLCWEKVEDDQCVP